MYYRILPELKNALRAGKEKMTVPFSRMDLAIFEVLRENGYVKSIDRETIEKRAMLVVRLPKKKGGDIDFRLLSKPSRRFYSDYRSLHRVRQGYGIGVLSTPLGILSVADAKKKKVGGEYLFELW
jgi:small subunit ribosomal protein S8